MPAQAFLVEHYWPGVTAEVFRDAAGRLSAEAGAMDGITFLHSTLVRADESACCVFSARSQTLVEEAYRRAGVPFERIVDALELEQEANAQS